LARFSYGLIANTQAKAKKLKKLKALVLRWNEQVGDNVIV
jgi:hypothetical protein